MATLPYPTTEIGAITQKDINVKSYESNLTAVYNYINERIQLLKDASAIAKLEITELKKNNDNNEKDKLKLETENKASLQKIIDLQEALKKASSTLENIAKTSQ